ncbi:type II toxin-antitoxin system death-on-curing family toxin [Streptococcus marmotae]|uniref:type II toxin-antitoxin system death-on-curing family toxin n=1 Tax=Streptococcus marmotae TaxID=1825069 RepID=UPI00083251E4|nr:type II toxin-antitoxin system death-on-curing family toxin [Streptococcus marmotae]
MRYLSVEDIIKINVAIIQKYSPKEPVGITDANSLNMIVEQPKQEIFGKTLYPTIESKAAILWINLIKKHPFKNANKRTAFIAMQMFFQLNGYRTAIPIEDGLHLTLEIATFQGNFETLKEKITNFLSDKETVQKSKS